ncbi:hypothetical protein QP568_08635 [Propionimicrobium lymphophilum]|uniref:hypothetical protein n=1 Tax=Propionimicrobium TaxID=203133 RepID=UPI0003A781A4|nr:MULTISPECIES: hypothetical protein [Propionimicrobium]ETJ96816.1 hypothetical protein HMPREF1255_0797 [Propionimicrobium sp. BV2F7]MDK7710696.1 hypothetical protein [Propionimicrobium lymphophilum]MDK7734351.1 hypothetical protein [Propionimicrobium lymphophilum]
MAFWEIFGLGYSFATESRSTIVNGTCVRAGGFSSLVFIDGDRSLRIVSESGKTKLHVKAWKLESIGLD